MTPWDFEKRAIKANRPSERAEDAMGKTRERSQSGGAGSRVGSGAAGPRRGRPRGRERTEIGSFPRDRSQISISLQGLTNTAFRNDRKADFDRRTKPIRDGREASRRMVGAADESMLPSQCAEGGIEKSRANKPNSRRGPDGSKRRGNGSRSETARGGSEPAATCEWARFRRDRSQSSEGSQQIVITGLATQTRQSFRSRTKPIRDRLWGDRSGRSRGS